MSMFERGGPGAQIVFNPRRPGTTIPDPDRRRILPDVVGLAVTPAVAGEDPLVGFMQAVGIGGDIVSQVASARLREQAQAQLEADRAERLAERTEREAERVRRVMEGAGQQAFAREFPIIAEELAASTAVLGDEDIAAQSEQIIRSRLSGMGEDAIQGAIRQFQPDLVRVMARRRTDLQETARSQTVERLLTRAAVADAGDIDAIGADLAATDPTRFGDGEGRRAAAARAANFAAATGNRERFEAMAAIADNPILRATGEVKLAERQEADEREAQGRFSDRVSSIRVLLRDGLITPEAAEGAMRADPDYSDRAFASIGAPVVDAAIAQRERAEEEAQREVRRINQERQIDNVRATMQSQVRAMMSMPGGLSNLPRDLDVTVPGAAADGGDLVIPFNRQDVIDQSLNEAFADVDATATDPTERLAGRIDILRNQNGAVEFSPWRAAMMRPLTFARPGVTPADVPDDVVAGYELYRSIRAAGGQDMLARHTDASTIEFHRLVDAHLRNYRTADGSPVDIRQAIAAVANIPADRAISRVPAFPRSIDAKVDEAARSAASELGLDDRAELRNAIASRIEHEWRMTGGDYSPESVEAAKKSVTEDYVSIDGRPHYVRDIPGFDRRISDAAPRARRLLAERLGVDPETVSFTMGPGDVLTLRDASGLPVDGAPVVTVDEMADVLSAIDHVQMADRVAKSVERRRGAQAKADFNRNFPATPMLIGSGIARMFVGTDPADAEAAAAIRSRASAPRLSADAKQIFDLLSGEQQVASLDGAAMGAVAGIR